MIKKFWPFALIVLPLVIFWGVTEFVSTVKAQGNPVVTVPTAPGACSAPSGACSGRRFCIDYGTGIAHVCASGTWTPISGSVPDPLSIAELNVTDEAGFQIAPIRGTTGFGDCAGAGRGGATVTTEPEGTICWRHYDLGNRRQWDVFISTSDHDPPATNYWALMAVSPQLYHDTSQSWTNNSQYTFGSGGSVAFVNTPQQGSLDLDDSFLHITQDEITTGPPTAGGCDSTPEHGTIQFWDKMYICLKDDNWYSFNMTLE